MSRQCRAVIMGTPVKRALSRGAGRTAISILPFARVTNYASDSKGPGRISSAGSGYVKIMSADLRRSGFLDKVFRTLSDAGFHTSIAEDSLSIRTYLFTLTLFLIESMIISPISIG